MRPAVADEPQPPPARAYEPRRDRRFGLAIRGAGLLAGVVGVTAAAVVHTLGYGLNWLVGCLVGAGAAWAIGATAALALYRCRGCGRRIGSLVPPPDSRPGGPIRFRCDRCRIEWDTKLSRISRSTPGP